MPIGDTGSTYYFLMVRFLEGHTLNFLILLKVVGSYILWLVYSKNVWQVKVWQITESKVVDKE